MYDQSKKYYPEISAFFSGMMVMVFELLAARVLGVYVGTSLFVWTSIIAIVLGALAYGYVYGGKIADRGGDIRTLAKIFFISGCFFFLIFFVKDSILSWITDSFSDIRVSSIFSSLLLLAPVGFVLGMVPPIATKLKIQTLEEGGKVIGAMGGIGTFGSIFGTLLAGFFLIPYFGVSSLILLLALMGFILACMGAGKKILIFSLIGILASIGAYFWNNTYHNILAKNGIHIVDTAYSHVTVKDELYNNRQARRLYIDNVTHAGMYYDNDLELLHEYTKYYDLFEVFTPEAQNVVMLGGAAYGYPKHFLKKYPEKNIDVVEIDAGVTEIAKKYFRLEDNPNLGIYHEDARVFFGKNTKKYDAILGDAFGSYYSIPYQLTTREFIQEQYDALSEDGVVILNIIGSLEGKGSKFLRAEYKSFASVFPHVYLVPVRSIEKNHVQNIMLVALKNQNAELPENKAYRSYLSKITQIDMGEEVPLLSDDFAPVDYYISELSK